MYEGKDFSWNLFGKMVGVEIPGLSPVMDKPLDWIRRIWIWTMLFFWDRDSGFAPFVINNTKKFIRILTFNKNEWKALLATMRVFITILFLFLRLIFVLIK
ncbi:MAG: hypothetical protein QGD88_10440 [Anaerolineae bacterium]|nr:hypothetical protein [Anaerolineae bacterium]